MKTNNLRLKMIKAADWVESFKIQSSVAKLVMKACSQILDKMIKISNEKTCSFIKFTFGEKKKMEW